MIETCIIVAIITFIFLRSNKRETSYDPDYAKFERDLERGRLENQQTIENMRLEREIEAEVFRRVQRHKNIEQFKKETEGMDGYQMHMHPLAPRIEIFNPLPFSQTIYDINTAKYADVDIMALIDEKVKARIEDNKSMLPAIKVIEKEEKWIIMENSYISKDDVIIDKDNNLYIVLEDDFKRESVIDNSTMPYFATERNVKRGKIILDKGHEKINVGDLLYVDHSLKNLTPCQIKS
jgi:hypothetical protein